MHACMQCIHDVCMYAQFVYRMCACIRPLKGRAGKVPGYRGLLDQSTPPKFEVGSLVSQIPELREPPQAYAIIAHG